MSGRIRGKYELLEVAGEGGMATVWKAMAHGAAGFRRPVAIKRILPRLQADEQFIAMFVEEARVGSELHHPNIVQIIDFEIDEKGSYYLVMEWVEGLDLRRYLGTFIDAGKPTPWPLIAGVAIETLRGLSAAHVRVDADGRAAPVVHRDVAPQNIILGINGSVKVTDFGLSRAADRARMTQPHIVKGKLSYLAPEIPYGVPASPQSDIFSLGVVLWESLAGRKLREGTSDMEVFLEVKKNRTFPNLRELRGDLPGRLIEIIEGAMQPEPAARFVSAHRMERELAQLLRDVPHPTHAHQLGLSVVGARRALGLQSRPAVPPPPPAL